MSTSLLILLGHGLVPPLPRPLLAGLAAGVVLLAAAGATRSGRSAAPSDAGAGHAATDGGISGTPTDAGTSPTPTEDPATVRPEAGTGPTPTEDPATVRPEAGTGATATDSEPGGTPTEAGTSGARSEGAPPTTSGGPPPDDRRARSLQALALAGVAVLMAAAGDLDLLSLVAFGLVWPALVPLALLLGDIWPRINPLRLVGAALARVAGDAQEEGARRLPTPVGRWPAAALLFAVVALDTAIDPSAPALLALAGVGVLVVLVGALLYGPAWFTAADPFEAVTGLAGRLAPGSPPAARLAPLSPGELAALAALLGGYVFHLQLVTASASFGAGPPKRILSLAVSVGLVWVLAAVAARPRVLAAALVPLVPGYAFLHHVPVLLVDGQVALRRLVGTDIRAYADPDVLSSAPLAVAALTAFLLAHAAAVFLAHRIAVARYDPRTARAVQFPLRVLLLVSAVTGVLAGFR